MQIDIDNAVIEDIVRDVLDGVDLIADIDIEDIVTNEISGLDLLEGINVQDLVKYAIKDAVEDSDDFNAFMKMRGVVHKLELVVEQQELSLIALSTKYNNLSSLVRAQDAQIDVVRMAVLACERKQSNPFWKFWA